MMAFPILSTLLIVPLIGVALLVLMPRDNKELLKWIAFIITLVNLAISLPLYFSFVETTADSSGNDNTGMLYNGPTWRPLGGQTDGALEFDGIDDYVEITE